MTEIDDYHIRFLEADDFEAFRQLRLYGLKDSPENFGMSHEEEIAEPLSSYEERFTRSTTGDNRICGAFVELPGSPNDGALIAVSCFARNTQRKATHYGYIWGVFTHPTHRRLGLGKALMDSLLDHARGLEGFTHVQLGVNAGNTAAREHYRGLGFEPYGIERNAIRIGDHLHDEILMVHWIQPPVFFESERLRMRRWTMSEADLDATHSMWGDPEMMRYVGNYKPVADREVSRSRMQEWVVDCYLRNPRWGTWALVCKEPKGRNEEEKIVGSVILQKMPDEEVLEVGWHIIREHWGEGYATEAALAAIRYAFEELDQRLVVAVVHPENAASLRVAEKCGFTLLGTDSYRGKVVQKFELRRE